ncbi:hypothetical protein H0X09_01285 [Candidatus Saccharibacteria bacterium]|nr:hypothetical protein [Candidatus Saccharibacteria bacterium]
MRTKYKKTDIFSTLLVVTFLLASQLLNLFYPQKVSALDFTNRSILVSSAVPLASVSHNFSFTYISTSSVGSIVFEYCENSPVETLPCSAPAGLDVSSAALSSQSGNIGFTVDAGNTTANKIVLTRPTVAGIATASTYNFSSIINPSTSGVTEFVRLSTRASTDGSGADVDSGSVAFATISPFNIATFVPPFLRLCVGVTVAVDCSTASGNSVNFGDFSVTQAKTTQSQLAAGTNSITGYNIFALGTTMTSGNNFIPALASPTLSQPGTSQFGINLKANSNPLVGQEPTGSGSGAPSTGYNTVNLFKFSPGDQIANSTQPSDFNLMTVSYLGNISSGQAAGIYSTTFTYLATADF